MSKMSKCKKLTIEEFVCLKTEGRRLMYVMKSHSNSLKEINFFYQQDEKAKSPMERRNLMGVAV